MSALLWIFAVIGALCVGTSTALILFIALAEVVERRRSRSIIALMTVSSEEDDEYIEWLERRYWSKETT